MPHISVIIPAFNAEQTIAETLASVLQQSYVDFEVIVVDDGSTDETVKRVQQFEDARIQITSYPNAGLSTARNRGIANATGTLITFLDADDLWTVDKLEKQVQALDHHPSAGVVYSWTCYMYERENELEFHACPAYSYAGDVYAQLLVQDFIFSGSNVLIRREAIEAVGRFDPTLRSCEDWDYWLRLAARWEFALVPAYQILYRQTPGALTSNVEQMQQSALRAIENAYRLAPAHLQRLKPLTLANFNKYCADLYLNRVPGSKSLDQAMRHLSLAIQLRPQTVLEPSTLRTLIKLVIKKAMPQPVATQIIQSLARSRQTSDPRLNSGV